MRRFIVFLLFAIVCEVSCNHISYDTDGYARVEKNGRLGLLDSQKRLILPYDYEDISLFTDGVATVKKGGKKGAVNTVGKTIIICSYEDLYYDDGVFVGKNSLNRWVIISKSRGYYNELKTEFCSIARFGKDSLASAQDNSGRYGIINKAGETVVPFLSEAPFRFDPDGYACVKQNGKYGVINTDLKIVVPLQYDNDDIVFDNNLAFVVKNGKHGAVEIQGDILVPIVPCVYQDRSEVITVLENRWILGTWVLSEKAVTAYYTFHADGTCSCKMVWAIAIPTSYVNYPYSISGDIITLTTSDNEVITFQKHSDTQLYVDSAQDGIKVKQLLRKI